MNASAIRYWLMRPGGGLRVNRQIYQPGLVNLPSHHCNWSYSNRENVGRWTHFELRVAVGSKTHSDQIQAWVDGALCCNIVNGNFSAGYRKHGLNAFSWMAAWSPGSPKEQSRFFDDLILSTEPVGPARTGFNPVMVKAPFRDPDGGDHQQAWEVEVAQAAQKPLVAVKTVDGVVTQHEPPQFTYTVVWRGTVPGEDSDVEVNSETGQFVGPLAGKPCLEPNTYHFVRLRQQDAADNWSSWSSWHAAFATTWDPQTPVSKRRVPKGYLLGYTTN